jgi:hypothetical protein
MKLQGECVLQVRLKLTKIDNVHICTGSVNQKGRKTTTINYEKRFNKPTINFKYMGGEI